MDLLRIATAGSVDDGKSTLIGRLLFETNSLKEDQLDHIIEKSQSKGLDFYDFSLATDGLLTEREQGITIDVSNIYFKTPHRRFIIADSPGHVEYTRNMVTGTSNADAVIILLDARKGVVEQTLRHLYITHLLRVKYILFAINKMDLVDYNPSVFETIKKQLDEWMQKNKMNITSYFMPISALTGENLTKKSEKMKWYKGARLIDIIETLPLERASSDLGVMHVQNVIRPQLESYHDYRGFAGKVKSGTFKVGDSIQILPSGKTTKIKSIERYGKPIDTISAGQNATLLLTDEIQASRGSVLVHESNENQTVKKLNSIVCWMQEECLQNGKKYWLQQGTQTVLSKVEHIESTIDLSNGCATFSNELKLNDIGQTSFQLAQPIYTKSYAENKALGAFILIDQNTFNTAGVGFIL